MTHPRPTDVTLSTKCWEGDYRQVLDTAALSEIFGPFGHAGRRQVVLNRIVDRGDADARARRLLESGAIDVFAWADEAWPELARRLQVPETWFGPAWPYAVPELTELALATTPLVAHIAGDVRLETGEPWLPRALAVLPQAAAVSPVSPSRIELVRPEARAAVTGWVHNADFSDQCFLARTADLLSPEVVRATHPATGRYPKPGGALTFEARVGAWLRQTGRIRLVDIRRGYRHPVGGQEGATYAGLGGPAEHLPDVPPMSGAYPAAGSVEAAGVIVARNAVRTIAWAVASLQWLRQVVVVDQASTDGTADRARAAGALVQPWPVPTVTGRAILGQVAAEIGGWLVLLDGDEMVPPGLANALAVEIQTGRVQGVEAPRRSYLLGRPAPGRHYWPAFSLRAVRVESAVFPTGLEALRTPLGLRSGASRVRLPADESMAVVHLGRPDLHAWTARANNHTSLEARGTEISSDVSLRRAAKRFATRYLREGGWRAGRQGWRVALLEAMQHWLLTEKAWELVDGGATAALAVYDEIAAAVLAGTPPDSPVTRSSSASHGRAGRP